MDRSRAAHFAVFWGFVILGATIVEATARSSSATSNPADRHDTCSASSKTCSSSQFSAASPPSR